MIAMEVSYNIDDCLETALTKAKSLLVNFAIGNYRECVSASYFVAESMVKCLLAAQNLYARTHEGIRVLLARHFVKSNQISREAYNFFSNLYLRRLDADYSGSLPFTREDVKRYVNWIKLILEEVRTNLPVLENEHEEKLKEISDILENCLTSEVNPEIFLDLMK